MGVADVGERSGKYQDGEAMREGDWWIVVEAKRYRRPGADEDQREGANEFGCQNTHQIGCCFTHGQLTPTICGAH